MYNTLFGVSVHDAKRLKQDLPLLKLIHLAHAFTTESGQDPSTDLSSSGLRSNIMVLRTCAGCEPKNLSVTVIIRSNSESKANLNERKEACF